MKRIIMTMMAILSMTMSASAMSYEQARREALFLTDKMAYELNLNDRQYDAAYEINLDYLMGVTTASDVYGTYWTRRNLDLGYILLDWQWNAFCAATYFYRPLYWHSGYWHFGIYARYPRRDYFYFGHPTVYISYRGGHSWRHNGGRSYYQSRRHDYHRPKASHNGMRDRWDSGEIRRNNGGNSSTRVTVNNGNSKTGGTFSGSRSNTSNVRQSGTAPAGNGNSSKANGSFGGSRNNTAAGTGSTSVTRPASKPATTSGSFGSSRGTTSRNSSVTTTQSNATSIRSNTSATRSNTAATRGNITTTRHTGTQMRSSGSFSRSSSPSRSVGSSSRGGGNSSKSSGSFGGRR